MRIAITSPGHVRTRGVERVSVELADGLVRRGHAVDFYCVDPPKSISPALRFHRLRAFDGTSTAAVVSKAAASSIALGRSRHDLSIAFGMSFGADIIIAGSCHAAGVDAAREHSVSRVTSSRNLGIADACSIRLEKWIFGSHRFNKIVTCSSVVKAELQKYYAIRDRDILVIAHGVDNAVFRPSENESDRSSIRQGLGIGAEEVALVFAGNEFLRKGLETVIRALAILHSKTVRLFVLGDDDAANFLSLAQSLGVGDSVAFKGSATNIHEYFKGADLFVLPTYHEAFGLVVAEAMACAVPCMVTRTAGVAMDFMTDNVDGILLNDPSSGEELAERLVPFIEDPELRRRVGRKGMERVRHLTWDTYAESVLRVADEVRKMDGRR